MNWVPGRTQTSIAPEGRADQRVQRIRFIMRNRGCREPINLSSQESLQGRGTSCFGLLPHTKPGGLHMHRALRCSKQARQKGGRKGADGCRAQLGRALEAFMGESRPVTTI